MPLFGEITNALFRPSSRAIDIIIPDVVFEEAHRDELIITQHPVERGAAITDHAFKRPAELEMRCGWSDSTAGFPGYSRQVYQRLLALQAERRPFSVYTGKRRYENMLIRGLAVTTDARSEYAALVVVALQEIIITSTQITAGPQSGTGTDTAAASQKNAQQGEPASTGSVTDRGGVAGSDVGPQAFAGAFNPGSTSTGGDLGLGGAVGESLDGLSQPTVTGDVGEMLVQDGETGQILSGNGVGVGVTPYNVFGS